MLSKLRMLLLLAGIGATLLRCDSEDSRIFDVCETLTRCTGYLNHQQCSATLQAAIADQRITTSAVARCSQCVGRHAPPQSSDGSDQCAGSPKPRDLCQPPADKQPVRVVVSCEELLNDRACDTACEDVSLVVRSRTSSAMREQMCARAASCGDDFASADCRDADASVMSCRPLEAQLEADADVDACRKCLIEPLDLAAAKVNKTDQGTPQFGRAGLCELMVDACAEVCRKTAASASLNLATQILQVCKANSCFSPVSQTTFGPNANDGGAPSGDATAGSGGVSGGGGGASAGSGGSSPAQQPCFERVMSWLSDPESVPRALCHGCGDGGSAGEASMNSAGAAGGAFDDCLADRLAPRSQVAICAACVADKDCPSITAPCAQACKKLPLGIVP
jgi:hypothetical protein